ncbi:MAG: PAS domain-containing sensor histidine kinase [Bacteroidales bacterium]
MSYFELIAGSLIEIDQEGICEKIVSLEDWPDSLSLPETGNFILPDLQPTEAADLKNELKKVYQTGKTIHYKCKYKRHNTEQFLVFSIYRKSASSLLVQLKDWTDTEVEYRKRKVAHGYRMYEEQIWQWNMIVNTMMEHVPFFIFVKDVKDEFRYIYHAIGLKNRPDNVSYTGKNDYDFLPAEVADRYHFEDLQVINANKSLRFVHTHVEDGKEVVTETMKIYVNEPNRDPIIIGIGWDITDHVQKHRHLMEVMDRTKESESIKTNFIANISQEIRSPLNAILGFSELLATSDNADNRMYYKTLIDDSSKRLTLIIDELLDLTRMKNGDVDLAYSEVSPFVLCEELMNMYRNVKHKLTELRFETSDPDLIIESDSIRLFQAMSYILNSVCRLTFDGKINFGYYISSEWFYFYINDSAIELAEDLSLRLASLDTQTDKVQAGIILELSLCKMIIESMGGNIYIKPEVKGTKVSFRIPVRNRR